MNQKLYFLTFLFFGIYSACLAQNSALNFDGMNDRVDLGNSMNTIIDGINTFTVEAMVRPETVSGLGVIVGNYATGNNNAQFVLRRDLDRYNFIIDDGTGLKQVDFSAAVVNQWTHIAGVWDGSELRIYIDGTLQDTTTGVTGGSFVNNNNPIFIGRNNINENFDGDIDEVRIWTTARTQSEIDNNKSVELSGNETGLLAYYNFNQGVAGGNNTGETTLNDISVNGYNGTLFNFNLTGATSNWVGGFPIEIPQATHLNFDGINDHVDLGDTIESLGDFTFETWIYHASGGTQSFNEIFSKFNVNSLNIWRAGGSKVWFHLGNGFSFFDSGAVVSNASVPFDQWTHLAITWDQSISTISIYINGVLDIQQVHTHFTGSFMGNSSFRRGIGGYPDGPVQNFEGSIDELRVWNRIRTVEEINGSMSCELQGNEADLLAYYNFNQGSGTADNTSETIIQDASTNAINGTLTNFSLTGTTSNWLSGSPIITGSIVPDVPTVASPILYNEGESASPLTATIGTNGTALLWYTTATGGTGTSIAPTPDTAVVGDVSYWVSSTNDNGCESERVELMVSVSPTLSMDNPSLLDEVKIYPNPTSNYLFIELPTVNNDLYSIYDINGRLLLKGDLASENNRIDISKLNSGVYILKVSTLRGEVLKRILKN